MQIGDLEALASDTHKFEKHYTDTLVAEYGTEEGKEEYRKRSPILHIDRLACPILLFQGLKDMVRGRGRKHTVLILLTA